MAVKKGYKQTEVGVIPEDWSLLPLEYFTSYISYGFTNPMPTTHSGVYMITARDINNGRIQFETARCTTVEAYRTLLTPKSRPVVGDLLLTKDGTLGRLAIVDTQTVCINQSVAILRPNNKANVRFLKLLLESQVYQKRMQEDAGGSTIKHIYITIVNRMPIALPPTLREQEAIAGALSDADAWIESLEQMIAKKRQIKQGAMQELLTGKRRLPGFSGKWETKRLGDVANVKTGSKNNEDKVEDGEFPFFVRSDTVERINTFSHDCEAILVPGEGRIGDIFHYISGRFDVHQRVYAITRFVETVSPRFLYFYLKKSFGVWAMQNTVKATVDSLRLPTFTSFEMTLPSSLQEQTTIATVLSDMDTEIESLESKLAKAREVKQGMMQELLTGRIRLV
jgi:type I restriction enzyme S subunit